MQRPFPPLLAVLLEQSYSLKALFINWAYEHSMLINSVLYRGGSKDRSIVKISVLTLRK